jgi:hypothetical protein
LGPCKFDERVTQDSSDFTGPGIFWLEESTDWTDIGPKAHSAIGASVLIDFDKNPPRDLVVPSERMDSPHRAIGKTSLAGDTFILICLHRTSRLKNRNPQNWIQILIFRMPNKFL